MKPTFDMDALRTIVVGTELGSFARAASQLGRSQAAISMQLRKLERQADKILFRRNGRGLVPTEAGEALLAYARRIIALNDEAAASLGATAIAPAVQIGVPQDFVEDVMPEALMRSARQHPRVHIEVRAGRNYALEQDVQAGRLDVALAFFPPGSDGHGVRLATLPMLWLGSRRKPKWPDGEPVPLVLYDHPCLFRQAALQTLDAKGLRWRLSVTTPSLPGVWAAVQSGFGISVRTAHRIPPTIRDVRKELGLPKLPSVDLRLLTRNELSRAATDFRDVLEEVIRRKVIGRQ